MTHRNDNARAVAAKYMRQRQFTSTKTRASPQIDAIERRRLELDDGILRRFQFRLAAFFPAQLIDTTVAVNSYGFQNYAPVNYLASRIVKEIQRDGAAMKLSAISFQRGIK